MVDTYYLVSGANKGIGLGFVKALVVREGVQVFAGARNPKGATELKALQQQHPGKVHIIKLVSADEANNAAAVEEIRSIAGRLDVVIANAGILGWVGPSTHAPVEEMLNHYKVNTLGSLVLFQKTYPLLKASTPSPKFIIVSSGLGSIQAGTQAPLPALPYGASKAALNYLARRLHFENENLIVYPICPGTVDTDAFNTVKERNPNALKAIKTNTVEHSVSGMMTFIDKAERQESGPHFASHDGNTLPW